MADGVQQVYDQLVKTRNTQLKYMSRLKRKDGEFGFIITPALVFQHTYVHQLVNSFRNITPPDICVVDGGFACSNLTELKLDRFDAEGRIVADDGSDYILSRIIDLLDRPISTGDHNLTVNVRDEFAANIRTLSLLFEERYKLCSDHSDRLKNDLLAVRQQIVASRKAKKSHVSGEDAEQTVRNLRDQVSIYETRLTVAREQMEQLKRKNQDSVKRNRIEVDRLLHRLSSAGRSANDDLFLQLLQNLVVIQDAERERVFDTLLQIERDIGSDGSSVSQMAKHVQGSDKTMRHLNNAVDSRVNNELPLKLREIENDAELEINTRSLADETKLRAELEIELNSKKEEIVRAYEAEVTSKVSQTLNDETNVQTVVEDRQFLPVGTDDTRLKKIKRTLDVTFEVNASEPDATVIPHMPPFKLHFNTGSHRFSADNRAESTTAKKPRLVDVKADRYTVSSMYGFVDSTLKSMSGMYGYLLEQSRTLENLAAISSRDYVRLDSMTAERTETFIKQTEKILASHAKRLGNGDSAVFKYFDDIRKTAMTLKSIFNDYFSMSRRVRQADQQRRSCEVPQLNQIREESKAIERTYREHYKEPLSDIERRELEDLRKEVAENLSAINRLHETLKNTYVGQTLDAADDMIKSSIAKAELRIEVSMRIDLMVKFRRLYNELANTVIALGAEFKGAFRNVSDGRSQPRFLRDYIQLLNQLLNRSDRVIDFGYSPRPVRELCDILPGLDYFVHQKRGGRNEDAVLPEQVIARPSVSGASGPVPRLRKSDRWADE